MDQGGFGNAPSFSCECKSLRQNSDGSGEKKAQANSQMSVTVHKLIRLGSSERRRGRQSKGEAGRLSCTRPFLEDKAIEEATDGKI